MSPDQSSASLNVCATQRELEAAVKVFEAECFRGLSARLNRATEAAHADLQAHLDATAANIAIARRSAGL